jgi:fermentation-respiration switch protein FrsA (DUF1100 family)
MQKERIEFIVDGDKVVGDLHLPSGDGPYAGVIVGGPMTSVKEQVTGVYAQALAERGIAALAIDHRHYGESGGEPRQYENYHHKIQDLKAALDTLAKHPAIDAHRIGAVGVCLGVGYVMWSCVDNPLVKAIGGVVGYYRDVTDMKARDPDGFAAKVEQGVSARKHYEATGEVLTVPAVSTTGDAAMTTQELVDYYGRRAAVSNYKNSFALMSREFFLPFDVQPAAPRIGAPVCLIHSEKALSPHWARKYYDALTVPKQMHWLESSGQVEFYDNPALVTKTSDLLAEHLRNHLG